MRHASLVQTALVALLAAGCSDIAAAQRNAVSCKGKPGKLTSNGACPVDNCFDDPAAGQVVKVVGTPGSDWLIGLKQCIKPSGSISFISWAPAGPNGECDPSVVACGGNKVESIPYDASFVDIPIPYGKCSGDPICVYVHDGQLKKGSGGAPQAGIPDDCYSSSNQLCEMCGAYLVTPRLVSSESCVDPYSCTAGDACTADSVCEGNPVNSNCDDGVTCTEGICVGKEDPASVGVDSRDVNNDASGCGFKPTTVPGDACDDGFSCTNDLCVELTSVAQDDAPANAAGDPGSGCFFEKVDSQCPVLNACSEPTCVAGPDMPPGSGCTYSEKVVGGGGYCAAKYGSCAAALCVGADGNVAYEGGTTDDDGCTVRTQTVADATCPAPPDCGEGKCDLSPGASGDGCFFNAGAPFDSVCEAKKDFTCQVGTCEVGTGVCKFATNDGACNDGISCTEDICLAGGDAAAAGINPVDVDATSGCGRKEAANVCNDNYSCTTDLCVALNSVTSGATADPTTGCASVKDDSACSQTVRECAVATCVADASVVEGGDGCTYTDKPVGQQSFCGDKYPACAAAVCADVDNTQAYAGGSVEADGCSINPSANDNCDDPQCGAGVCNPAPGGGCTVQAGSTPANDAVCAASVAACQISTCTDAGTCSAAVPRADFCETKYEKCAGATCAPDAPGDDDGCSTQDQTAADNTCAAGFPVTCGTVSCGSLAPITAPSGVVGSGCILTPQDSDCSGAPCQQPTCSAEGECTTADQGTADAYCQNPANYGPFTEGGCVTPECKPDASSDTSGCAATINANSCLLPQGSCGTSTCNAVTGDCEQSSNDDAGVCGSCAACVDNVCMGPGTCDADLCQTCGTGSDGIPVCTGSCPEPECDPVCDSRCEMCDKTDPANPTCTGGPCVTECDPVCTDCQVCTDGVCTGGPCVTGCDPVCQGCQVCTDGTCTDSIAVTYDMVCYKCGTEITCAVMAPADSINVGAIQQAVIADCGANKGKTCQNQLCKGNLAVYASETCYPFAGPAGSLQGNCPCSSMGISNYAGYRVTVGGGANCSPASITCSGALTGKCEAGQSGCSDFGDQSCTLPDATTCGTTVPLS